MSMNVSNANSMPISRSAKEQLKDKIEYKKTPEQMVPGYKPPNVALEPIVPNTKYVCDIYESSAAYTRTGIKQDATPNEAYNEIMQNLRNDYQYMVKAYRKIFDECDEDIAFCEDLVNNNTDPSQKDLYDLLLERAKTRRKNIAEQAEYELSGRCEEIAILAEKLPKYLRAFTSEAEAEQLRQTEAGVKKDGLFEKLREIDFSRIAEGPNATKTIFDTLDNLLAELLAGVARY